MAMFAESLKAVTTTVNAGERPGSPAGLCLRTPSARPSESLQRCARQDTCISEISTMLEVLPQLVETGQDFGHQVCPSYFVDVVKFVHAIFEIFVVVTMKNAVIRWLQTAAT
jgi:hypothetical protein